MIDTTRLTDSMLNHAWKSKLTKALLGLLGLWLVAWLSVPPLLKWQLQKQASAALGRVVTVDAVDFHPWSLELTLHGLKIAHSSSTEAQLAVERVYVDAELQSLLRLAPVVDALALEKPNVQLRHLGEGRYDIDDLLAKFMQPSEPSEPTKFAIFNIAVKQGQIDFIDDGFGKKHEIRALELNVPFLSNLDSKRDILTKPHLSFVLNGNAFDTQAATTPFAQTRQTQATISIPALELEPYLPYWPAQWPIKPEAGQLQVQAQIAFEQKDTPQVKLSGKLGASNLRLTEVSTNAKSAPLPLLVWNTLEVNLAESQPLEQQWNIDSIRWDGAELALRRDASGLLNLQRMAQAFAPQAGAATADPSTAPALQVNLKTFELLNSKLLWRDASTRPAADIDLHNLNLHVRDLTWPARQPMGLEGSAQLGDAALSWKGQATDQQADIRVGAKGLNIGKAAPYLAGILQPQVNGQLSLEGVLQWQAAQPNRPPQLTLTLPSLELQSLQLAKGKDTPASIARLQAKDLKVDVNQQLATVGQLVLESPQISVQRNAQGRWMYEDWLSAAPQQAPAPSSTSPAWKLELADVQINNGQAKLLDEAHAKPVKLEVSALSLQAKNLAPNAEQPVAAPLNVSMVVGVPNPRRKATGKLSYQGQLRLPAPAHVKATTKNSLFTQGRLQLERLPVHALEPYFGDQLNLDLVRADTSYRGTLEAALPPDGLLLNLRGDVAVDNFRASTLSPAEDLLDWKALNLNGTQLQMAAGQLRQFTVSETVLSDYFARVIIDDSGTINLQNLIKPSPQTTTQTAPVAPAAPSVQAAPKIEFGPIAFVNGRVYFSDRFIRPNYSANLSELTGRLGAFSNQTNASDGGTTLADLSLRGRAEGSATLEVNGKLNPLAKPLALDIQGNVRELELPPLSPYSVKYAGHGIEHGKLSMNVNYKIDPDGQLSANNQIILNQLSFGERVEGSEAPNLPIKLAVALLADRNGMININLPISGSINDPEFRIGTIVFKLIFNLIGKAVTAPFALIASALGGGGEEMNYIAFAPGSAALDDNARQRLAAVVKALESRPTLKLTVVGQSDLEAERSGYQRTELNEKILAEKRRRASRDGNGDTNGASITSMGKDEYLTLLKAVYRRADIPKPRNFIGLAKDIPQEEMEKLLMTSIAVNTNDMRELAIARATAVKDYLAQQKIPLERLFTGQPVLAKTGEKWTPQAELRLAVD